MQVLDNGARLIYGHYEVTFPLRDHNARPPNNGLQAKKGLDICKGRRRGNINSRMTI